MTHRTCVQQAVARQDCIHQFLGNRKKAQSRCRTGTSEIRIHLRPPEMPFWNAILEPVPILTCQDRSLPANSPKHGAVSENAAFGVNFPLEIPHRYSAALWFS
jgi:hypothetical protein